MRTSLPTFIPIIEGNTNWSTWLIPAASMSACSQAQALCAPQMNGAWCEAPVVLVGAFSPRLKSGAEVVAPSAVLWHVSLPGCSAADATCWQRRAAEGEWVGGRTSWRVVWRLAD